MTVISTYQVCEQVVFFTHKKHLKFQRKISLKVHCQNTHNDHIHMIVKLSKNFIKSQLLLNYLGITRPGKLLILLNMQSSANF